ncbi:MAG: LPS export ABC transporter periplasmic protein LptC [Campylobacterota bacterium]|nr:LPS export ABC transporter periplasmic protein LptC [Campylobacterota bacterium]
MGITKFIYLLLVIAIIFLFYNQKSDIKVAKTDEKPLLVLENSIVYDITEQGLEKIVQFEKGFIFKNYEKSFETVIVSKDNNSSAINLLSAKQMVKRDDKLTLIGDIHLLNTDDFNLETEELQYNLKTKIAQNNTNFTFYKGDSELKGVGIYLDSVNKNIEASKAHFKIKLKDSNETK